MLLGIAPLHQFLSSFFPSPFGELVSSKPKPNLSFLGDFYIFDNNHSTPSHCGSFFMSLGTEDLFWEVLVFFIEGYSANSYDFGVLVR